MTVEPMVMFEGRDVLEVDTYGLWGRDTGMGGEVVSAETGGRFDDDDDDFGPTVGSMSPYRQHGWDARADMREPSCLNWKTYRALWDQCPMSGPPSGGWGVYAHKVMRESRRVSKDRK